jgi:hypothetical protein
MSILSTRFIKNNSYKDKMMKSKIIVMLCGLFLTGLANAECPTNLAKDELVKCQSIEKTGVTYQEWQDIQKEMAEKSTISPVTGKDVRSTAPAAGNEMPADNAAE